MAEAEAEAGACLPYDAVAFFGAGGGIWGGNLILCNGFAKFAVIIHIHIIIKRKNDEKIAVLNRGDGACTDAERRHSR